MKKNKKKLIIAISAFAVVIVAVLVSAGSCAIKTFSNINTAYLGVLAEPLKKHDLSTSVSASGSIESQSKISVTSDLTYKIAELNVSVGDYVKEGDILCTFDATELNAQIKTLENQLKTTDTISAKQNSINNRTLKDAKDEQNTQLEQANKAIEQASANLENSKTIKAQLEAANNDYKAQIATIKTALENTASTDENYEALQEQLSTLTAGCGDTLNKLAEQESVIASNQAALDEANTNYNSILKSTNQQIQSAQDTIDTQEPTSDTEAKNELESLKRKLEKIVVKADHSGIITSLNVQTGSLHTGGELMTIQDTNALKLTVSIKENDILNIKEGMKAIVTSNANPEKEITGTVTKVIDFVSTSTNEEGINETSYSAEITLPENSGLLLGMSAKAKIITSEELITTAVAYDSIIKEGDNNYVYKAAPTEDNLYTIEKVAVNIGKDSDYYTQISSDELKTGDYIISYPDEVSEGDCVPIDETYMTSEDETDEGGE